jgi:hypothetical protein
MLRPKCRREKPEAVGGRLVVKDNCIERCISRPGQAGAGRLAWGLPKRARVATQYGSLDDLFKIVRYAEPATIVNRREKVPLTGICGQERAHRTLDEPPSSARGSRFSGP